MSIGLEITIGNGKDKPKVIKAADGTWVIRGVLPLACVKYSRALWVKSHVVGEGLAKDGKGFLVTPTGKLTQG